MFAVAFDLAVAETARHHPVGVSQAYTDIKTVLAGYGFEWKQGSLYLSRSDDMADLFSAILALRALP